MKRTGLIILGIFIMLLGNVAYADVLGTQTGGWDTDMGAYTYFHNVVFQSDSQSVGQQTEYYVEYMPNSEAVPVVVNGESIWGRRNIEEAAWYMENNGMRPLVGINADYFSFKTGIPMGHTIIDGEIASKEGEGQDAVGFRADGTGLIDWLDIKTTLSDGRNSVDVMYINKWCQAGFDPIYLFTDKFGESTQTESECIFIICTPNSGRLKIGDTMTLTVDETFIYNGEITIPEGKLILAMDTSGNSEYFSFLSSLAIGQKITISNETVGNTSWNDIENGMGSVGGRLILNGTVQTEFEPGAAPRTAVGIKPDGNIIFYVLDGRQPGYSYGAQISTLAKRMSELGCVDAINLDGGGSTTIAGVFPGSDNLTITNHPSDGEARRVANFIFLKDNREPTGIPMIINLNTKENNNYLSGSTEQITAESVFDTHNYKMDTLSNVWYTVENYENSQSTVDENGLVRLNGTGSVKVTVSSDFTNAETYYDVYETPDEIRLYNESDWKEILEIYTEANEEFQLNLNAAAYVNNEVLLSDDTMFTWEIEGDIGTITKDGIFTLADTVNKSGRIKVTAGDCTKSIAVYISDYPKPVNPFADTDGHWAQTVLSIMAYRGVINGIEEDGKMVFKPDNDMTRAEFAVMLSNYLKLDVSAYKNSTAEFEDAYDIPLWAENAVKAMADNGIIKGKVHDDGTVTFNPYDKITRAEAMTILGRILEDKYDAAELNFIDRDDIPLWAEEGISKLISAGIVSGYSDNTILPNVNVKRAEAVNMMYKFQ